MNDNDRYEIDDTPLDLVIITTRGSQVCPTMNDIWATNMAYRTECPHPAPLAVATKDARS